MDTKRIYFNYGMKAMLVMMLLYGINDFISMNKKVTQVSAEVPIEKEKIVYQKVNINDVEELVDNMKQVLLDRVNILAEPKILAQDEDMIKIQLDEYTVEAELSKCEISEKMEIPLVIQKNNAPLKETLMMPVEFVDNQAPSMILSVDSIVLYEDEQFNPDLYIEQIIDNYDIDLTYQVDAMIPVNDNKLVIGSYDVAYECHDQSGNQNKAILHVEVRARNNETPVLSNAMLDSSLSKQIASLLGKPYVWGGKGPDGFDCSGIIMYLYQLNGIEIQWSDIQYGSGTEIALDPTLWQVGDVLSYMDSSGEIIHHALYLGNHMALHAITTGVSIMDIDTPLLASDNSFQKLARVMRYTNKFVNEKK